MANNAQFVVSSQLHEKNICSALSCLQQNGEFVDMTLAADGHFVKVHQVIIAIASPYLKDLVASANCQHPVIFLNKISHATLCLILEYVYTGEVIVSTDNLKELVEAGKELHIKGLEDMNLQHAAYVNPKNETDDDEKNPMNEIYLETSSIDNYVAEDKINIDIKDMNDDDDQELFLEDMEQDDKIINEESQDDNDDYFTGDHSYHDKIGKSVLSSVGISKVKITNANKETESSSLQYTVSNQGSLQIILNRIAAHTHPFHDERILKKLRAGAIFSALVEAEKEGENILRAKSIEANRSE
ncbi:PREDICTED: transcription factor GAGA-like isoform X2 [Papilio polytes]|uniref:transcription factor GAGA-like isoform X2 n=1 Tax=Papilio polytes TaxID=76194 RepID=UPI00067687AA|nr:PREDICTED: transcription factor GAGA-like isoform X2 [Papilio polytes]